MIKWRLTVKILLVICVIWLLLQLFSFHTSNVGGRSDPEKSFGKLAPRLKDHITGFGDLGSAVRIPASLQAESKRSYAVNQFNLVASDLIGLRRRLTDIRHQSCPRQFDLDLLQKHKTSIIIVFHNEAWSTLLRTVHSVIDRTPPELLEEIILVDDASDQSHLGQRLDDHLKDLPIPSHVERMHERRGLVQARLHGAKVSKGKTLTFLDAHCEVSPGWLEALLIVIAENPKRVVCPIIDVISSETFEYLPGSDRTWGSFDWRIGFHWKPVAAREVERINDDHSTPVRTPAMAGGLFTIDRDYFYHLGAYDPGMEIWGGENVEFSFRTWLCGGELLIAPCSHVGHVFRKVSPYTWPGGVTHILHRNNMRTVLVWMDEYKEFYLKLNPAAARSDYGDVSERLELRKKLNCKSFRWYLENIYPESLIPADTIRLGPIRNPPSDMCLDTMGRESSGPIGISRCHNQGGNQVLAWTSRGTIQTEQGCLDGGSKSLTNAGDLIVRPCEKDQKSQLFEYDNGKIYHPLTGLCMTIASVKGNHRVLLRHCEETHTFQWMQPPLISTSG